MISNLFLCETKRHGLGTSEVLEAPFQDLSLTWTTITNASTDRRWRDLLAAFVAFEKSNPVPGKLSTSSRPEEVQKWIQAKKDKKHIFPAIDKATYGSKWAAWWRVLQPSWRKVDPNDKIPMSRAYPEDPDWSSLQKGGTAGLWTVVVSLAWWLQGLDESGDLFWLAVGDVSWVLRCLQGDGIAVGEKRLGGECDDDRPQKRSR
ncbi:hypothetical protein DFP72DRAFT_828393 [Ephemerocybe angulata]|uniref:Uncharacterized protein n=1 Tax=Ephemerocybe angulata TaxID=980116 RepID=A0A8H6HCH4_9AGAR|nr:hypothetical protein DFP72DRAFT_828393 [Tulosesus angulatus]